MQIIDRKKLANIIKKKCVVIYTPRHIKYINNLFDNQIITKIKIEQSTITSKFIESKIKEYFQIFRSMDYIVCIGSGRIVDLSKIIKFKMFNQNIYLNLLSIPTLVGSGAESSNSAVYYKNNKKQTISGNACSSNMIFYDNYFFNDKLIQSKISMIDCLCQSIESIWSKKSNTTSLELASKSLKLTYKAFNSNKKSFNDLSKASYMIGLAMNITRTTGAHALSYYLTIFRNIPHGQSVSLILLILFKFHFIDDKLKFDNRKIKIILKLFKIKRIEHLYLRYFQLLIDNKLYIKLNLNKKEINNSLKYINLDRLGNHPVNLDKKMIKNIYETI